MTRRRVPVLIKVFGVQLVGVAFGSAWGWSSWATWGPLGAAIGGFVGLHVATIFACWILCRDA